MPAWIGTAVQPRRKQILQESAQRAFHLGREQCDPVQRVGAEWRGQRLCGVMRGLGMRVQGHVGVPGWRRKVCWNRGAWLDEASPLHQHHDRAIGQPAAGVQIEGVSWARGLQSDQAGRV